MGSITKSPALMAAVAAVLVALVAWGIVSWRRAAAAAPASGSVKVDIDKLREQVRSGGMGHR